MSAQLQSEHFETLRSLENLDGWNDREICDAFHKIWEVLAGYDNSIATTYFLQEQPQLIERVLKYSRLDVLPLDVAARDFGDFTEKYNFFKCDVSASDNAVVKHGQLQFTAYSYAALYIPPLNFGSLREMTVSFYFSIDNLGEDTSAEKRFGFRLGQLEVYFMPDTDITDIGQFRRCYTLVGGVGEAQMEYLDEAAFLEGELMRVVFQIHQDHVSSMHLCKTSGNAAFQKDLELNRLGFCNAASRATDFLGIFADGANCEKMFTIQSISLLQYEEDPQSPQLLPVWPELKSRSERLLWMVMDGCNKEYIGVQNYGADSRARAIGCVFTMLVHLTHPSIRSRCMAACSAILKSIDLLILRPEDKGALMSHLAKLVRQFDYFIGLEMSEQYLLEQSCLVHLLGHCVAGDEHRSSELLMVDKSIFSVGLQNCLSADARRAHRENVIARNESGTAEVNATIRLQNAALFCLSALGLPQASADLQEKGSVLEKRECPVGRLHPHDAERLLRLLGSRKSGEGGGGNAAASTFGAHPAAFPSYSLMFVVALKRELCVQAHAPCFQALIVNESNLPNVYVSLEDFTLCVQVRTKSGRLESAQSSLKLIDQVMPVAITVVVDGLLVFLYLNGREALDQPKRLSDYAAEVQAGDIISGRSAKAVEAVQRGDVTREEDPVLCGAMLMLRFFPRAMLAYEVESKVQVARSQAAKILKRKPGTGATEEIPLTVFNIIEVTQLVIQFTHVQLNDESLAAMGQKKAGLSEVLDPDTIMWMVLALGTAAMYLPHQHPKFLDLIKQPFVKVMQMIAGIIDGTSSKDLSNYEQAFIAACVVYVAFVLASPRGKNILQDELAAKLIIKMNGYSDSPVDFSDYVIKNCQQISSRVAVLILRAKQESPATLALVLDAIMSRMVNEDGVIYKEDLQEFLVDQGLGAVIQVLDFVGRGLLQVERRERERKSGQIRLTPEENEERAREEKAERLALEQVGTLAARLHRQLFLQLHHVMDEVTHGLPLDEVSMLALVKMLGTVLEVPHVYFMPASSLQAEKMADLEVAEGMPYECWRNIAELSCDKLRVWTEKFYPMSLRTYGEVSTLLEDLQEQVCVRDRRHISSPRLQIGASTQTNRVWIHFQSSQPKMMTDTEVRVLPVHEPPVEVPVKKSGHKYCAEPARLVAFANAVLCNQRFKDEVYANIIVLLAELNLPEMYTSMAPLLVQTALQSDWLCRLVSHELLHNVLYPDKHLLPLLYEAVLSSTTPLNTRYMLLDLCRRIAHAAFTPLQGFEEFLQVLRSRPPPELHPDGTAARDVPASMKPAHDAGAVSLLLSAISTGVPESVQVSVVGLATMVIARDINACEQAILENQYHDGVVVDGDKPFFLWRTFADLVSSRKRDLQKATARFLNTLFWRLPQDTIELTTRPRGQSSEEYWMLPRLLDALGHPDDEAVEDLLQVLMPLASPVQTVKKEDLEEEFAHLVFPPQHTKAKTTRETPAERLLREAATMISDGERVSVLVYLLRLLRPRFLRRALDWKASVRDFVLDLILNERVLTELTTAAGIADEFWVVVVQVLEFGGLPGQRWVAQTLRWLVRAAEQEVPEDGKEKEAGDLRLVRSACSPKILVPLVMHLARGALASASTAAKRMLAALEQVPDSLLSLLRHLPVTEQNSLLTDSLRRLLDSSKMLRSKGQGDAADAVATFASRIVLTYLSTGLVTEMVKRYPLDTTVEKVSDEGSKVFAALTFEMPGAISVKVMWESKKAMNTDILLTPTGADEAMALRIEDRARVQLSTRNAGDVVRVTFKPGFAKISQGRIFCGFDRATSKGDGKEEFVLKAVPVFVFRSIPRKSIDELFAHGHFEEMMKMLLPTSGDTTAIRGVPLAVTQACNWCYSVLAKELESTEEKLENLNSESVPVFPFLRLVLDIIHRLEAARPGEPELMQLEEQARIAGETMLTLSRSLIFRDAMLGGPDWEHVPVFLDIMKRRRREEWIKMVSYVLAQLLGIPDDKLEVRSKKLEIAAVATSTKASKMEIQTIEQVLEEVVPSPFTALLSYISIATKDGTLKASHAKVLCHVADMYALLLSEGWQPTFKESQNRPKDFMEVGKNVEKDKALPEELKNSDLFKFVTLLLSSPDPHLRAACFRAISALSARPFREQHLFKMVKFSKLCMEQPDTKTTKCYQGLPPQALTFALPSQSIAHPPFAFSFWVLMQEPTSRGELGRRSYFLMSVFMPSASGTPVISLALGAGHGLHGQDGRVEIWVGNELRAPDNEDIVGDGKTANDLAIVKAGVWVHVAMAIQHRVVSAYVQGEKVLDAKLQGHMQFSSLPAEPQRAVCFVGFPPPDLLRYQNSISIMEGLIAHVTYHDQGLTKSQVYDAYFRSRHMLPTDKDISTMEEANERKESIMYPYHHQQPSPLMWLVISDRWQQVDALLFAVLNSRSHLQRHGRDKGAQDLVRGLRMAATELLMNIIDLEAVVSHRLRQYALNFANVKTVTQLPFKLGISEDNFTIDFKLRFRGYALLEEGAKCQSILGCFAKKGNTDRDQFRISLEAGPVTSADDGMLAGEATGKQQAWHIIFCYNGQTTQLMLPPMTGDWLHVAISYVEGHTEIGCSWDGAPPRKVEADYSKMDQRVSVDGYVGLEVTRKKVMNNLLCDIHYFRAWKSSPGVDKVMARHSDAEAPDPILAAGDTIYTMTVAACIHEDRGYVLDLIPKERLPGAKFTGRNFTMFPAVRSRSAVTTDYVGAMVCAVHHVPRFVSPHPSLRLGLVQSQDAAAKAAAAESDAKKMKTPSYTARVAAEKFASTQIRASVPEAAVKAGVPSGKGCWACWRLCHEHHASQQFSWVIHHSADLNGQTKREQCWVGLLDEAGGDFYRFNCFDLEATADPRLMQQSPDHRLDHVVEKKKAMAKAALRRRGSVVTMQATFELQTRTCWVNIFINDMILDARILRLQHRRSLRCAAFVGNAGQHFSSLPPLFTQSSYGQLIYQLPGKPQDRYSKFSFPLLHWPSMEPHIQVPMPGERSSVYSCYSDMAEIEAIPSEHPANERARRRVLARFAQTKSDISQKVIEIAAAGCSIERAGLCSFPGDMLLLASLSAAEELWKVIGRKGGELGKAVHSICNVALTGSPNEVSQALEQKQSALQVVEMLLRYPHTYDQVVREGYMALLVQEVCNPPRLQDPETMSLFSSVSTRITKSTQRLATWATRRAAALALFRIMRLRSSLLSAKDAPDLIETLSQTIDSLSSVEVSVNDEGSDLKVTRSSQLGSEDKQVIVNSLSATINIVRSNLSKFSEALAFNLQGGAAAMGQSSDPQLLRNILRTLIRMVAYEDCPTRFVESQHTSSELMRHPTAKIFRCHVPMATSMLVYFDPVPIGRGAVKLFVGGEQVAVFNKALQAKATGNSSSTLLEVSGDGFEWQFIYDTDKVSSDRPGEGELSNTTQALGAEAITDENLGYRFYVVPCFEASTQEEAKEKRLLVMEQQLLVNQITKLHSKTQNGGLPGADEDLQQEIDLAVLTLLSYLSHLGEDEPHPAITSEGAIFDLMYQVLQNRPTVVELHDPNSGKMMTDEHVAASRFYYGLSLSEQGRSSFVNHQEAVAKIVDMAAEESGSATTGGPGSVTNPHEICCHDRGYVINTLTNFSCTPATWNLPNDLLLLRSDSDAMFLECEFARGSTSWSVSFHTYLNEEFNQPGKCAWMVYKGFTASDIQLAVGISSSETIGNRAGLHPLVLRFTHNASPHQYVIKSKPLECFKWVHICVSLDHFVLSLTVNGELTWAEEIIAEIPLMCTYGTADLCIGCPGWEFDRAENPHAWVYCVNIYGFKSLEPNEALFDKRREELMAWKSTHEEFDETELGRSGVDQLPNPLSMPASLRATFDTRQVVAARQGVEVLCELLSAGSEAQRRSAVFALRNLADPAVTSGLRRVVQMLMAEPSPGRGRRFEAVYKLLQTCQEAATFAAAAELVMNILNWEPPFGEKGVEDSVRLELIKHLLAPPIDPVEGGVDKARLEDRAPAVTHGLMTCVEHRRNVELMASSEVNAVDTFFKYLSCSQSLTVTRTLELLVRLVSRSTSEIRRTWAEDMCQSHHFKRLMEMVMQQGDKRIRGLYETLLGFVLKQCDQTRLMETVTSYSEDEITAEERFYIGKILYGCLSSVKSFEETRPLLAPRLADAMLPEHAGGVSRIKKLQIQGAPGIAVECVPLPPIVGNVRTQIKLWQPDKEQPYPVCTNPNEIYIWISSSESELDQPVERREVPPCVVLLCHTKPMPQRGEEVRDEEALYRYEGTAAEKVLCKNLDFADSIYYQVQFMSGRAIQPFVEQEDAELLQDEPPRVTLKLLCTNMVIHDMVEHKMRQNCTTAFAIIPHRSLSVAEFIFKQVEDIEEELLQELASQSKGEDTAEATTAEGAEGGDRLPEEMVILQHDPSRAVVFQQDVLRWARATRMAGKGLEAIGDGSVVNGGQDIDASKDNSAEAAAAAALRSSSSYGRSAERLRPIQRFFALCLVAMTKASLSRMSDSRERLIELMDSLDSYTAQAICEAILELLTLPKNIGLFSKSSIDKTLMSMEQTFQQPESAERSLIAFADILWKYLKPDSRIAEEGLKASVRIVRPLLELLSRSDTSKEQKSKIFTIIRQGMRFSIVSTDTFTRQGALGKASAGAKDKQSSTMHQVLKPMDSSLEAVAQEDARDTGELFFDLNLCFSAASVLKYICCTSSPEEHSQLIQLEVVPKMMRILSVIRDFLPRFANSKTNFSYEIPSFCTNPQTNQLYKPVYRLLPYTASTRLFREICGSISNCCQCLSNLMSDQFPTTNCIPLIQMLAFDEGDGLRDLYDMLRDVDVDIGINDQSLLADLHPDITLMVESLKAISINCNRIMRSRVLEVMYTALHPHGPVLPKKNAKKQDIKEHNHDYRILTYLKNSGAEADQKHEQFFLPSRIERAFTFSVWSRMDKGISTQIRVEWDCHSSQESTLDLKRMVEEGLDVLPIDASFRIIRKQQDDHMRLRYEEVRELRNEKRRRVWHWIDKGGADIPPRPMKDMKELKEQKGWAYMSFILEIEEHDPNKRVTSEKDDAYEDTAAISSDAAAKEKAVGDTRANAKLQVFYGLAKNSKPARPKVLEISKPRYDYYVQDQDIIGAGEFTLTTSSLGEGQQEAKASSTPDQSAAQMIPEAGGASATSGGSDKSPTASGLLSPAATSVTTNNVASKVSNQQQTWVPAEDDFARVQLETFLPLLMPFKTNAAANAGLLTISPYEVNTPERREAARRAIMMPDVFLSRDLVPELVPSCKVATTADLLSTLSAHTLYLLTMAFARSEPEHSSEEMEAAIKLGQFQQVLEQFRKKCTTGTVEENLGGIRVIVDVLWKLFTRRKKFVDEKEYKAFAQNKDTIDRGPYYWVRFVQRILELLTDLCIGPDGNAINEIQDFITRELIQTSEALSIRRRPPPECSENIWAKTSITVDDHLHARADIERKTGFVGSGKGLKQLLSQKDEFTLLKLGTSIFFDTFDTALEEVQAPQLENEEDMAQIIRNMVPRVLWMQQRAQPPRYEGRGYVQEDLDFLQPNQKIQPTRFLYFALVNLLAHLTADRNTDNSLLLQSVISPSVVRGQLIQREVLRNAGLVFCPSHLAEQRRQQGQVKESRDVADLSDLAALSSHTALLLHGFLGQPPFADESIRSSVISQVYLDGSRADDDDSAFDELPGGGAAPLTPDDLQKLCHMCSWQFASLAELCRDIASPGQPTPRSDFSDCMGHLVSVLSMLLSKLIGLGYFERFRKESEDRQRLLHERLQQGAYFNEEDMEEKSPTFELRWVTEVFSAMHRLVQVHPNVATDLYLAALKDVCRLLNMCCSLCVNIHVASFMETFLEFLPGSVKQLAGGSLRIAPDSEDVGKPISIESIEEMPTYVTILKDLAQVALPWQPPDSGDRACRKALSAFVQCLLDFIAMNDSALAIAAVMLLSRICRRRKDFLETIQRLQLLYVGDEPKFEALEPWVQEAHHQVKMIKQIGKEFEDEMEYIRDSNMEMYTVDLLMALSGAKMIWETGRQWNNRSKIPAPLNIPTRTRPPGWCFDCRSPVWDSLMARWSMWISTSSRFARQGRTMTMRMMTPCWCLFMWVPSLRNMWVRTIA